MPDPVSAQRPNPSSTPWVQAADDALKTDVSKRLMGASAKQTEAAQKKASIPAGFEGLAESTLLEVVGTVASQSSGVAAGVVAALSSTGYTLYSMVMGFADSVQEGKDLRHARERDAVNMASVALAAKVLPNAYIQAKRAEYADVGGQSGFGQGGYHKITNGLMASGQFNTAVELACRQAQAGRNLATQYEINSDAKLGQRLQSDANFASLYNAPENIPFRHGVQSVLFESR